MTILFPDVSEYTPNVDPAKYPALLARATLSDRVADPTYAGFKAKADAAGAVFGAYHWLNHGNLKAQAAWCFQHVGPQVPVMIDAEDVAGNTGYAGPLTVDDLTGFAAEYRSLGGIVSLCYLPAWYFFGPMGAPHTLNNLTAAGLGLVSSNYPRNGYTDNGPGWAPYYSGAPTPVQWQYASTPIDMNAFKGTAKDYAALIGLPQVKAESITIGEPMFLARDNTTGAVYLCTNYRSYHIADPATVSELVNLHVAGAQVLGTDDGTHPDWWQPWKDTAGNAVSGIMLTGWRPEVHGPVDTGPAPVALTDADLQTIVAGVGTQLGAKVDALTTLLTHVEQQLAAAGHALES